MSFNLRRAGNCHGSIVSPAGLGICVDLRWQVLRQNCEVACQLSTAGRITHSQSGGRIVAYTAFCHLISCLSTHKLVLGSAPAAASGLAWRPPAMRKKTRVKRNSNQPKKVLRLPDLEHAKSAVPDSLTSNEGRRCYCHAIDEFVDWYCSEPRLAFNRTVVLRYRSYLEGRRLAIFSISDFWIPAR
jgi:hypothetical protein